MLVGLQGVGKSAAGNTILGSEQFHSDISASALTLQTESIEGLVSGKSVIVVDTPGLFNSTLSDTAMKQEMERALNLCHPGPHAFLIVIQLGRFTEQERGVMDELVELLGSNINLYSMVLFSYGDKLKNKTIDQFAKEDKNLMKLIGKCGGQYHLFNNADTENKAQVRELLEKIDTMIRRRNKQPFYVKGAKHGQYSWATFLYISLPVVALLAISMMFIKNPVPTESLSQPSLVKEIISDEVAKKVTEAVPEQPEEVLKTSGQLWQMLHRIDFNWKELIPVALGLGAGWWILKKLRK